MLGAAGDPTLAEIGPLSSNYFSFTFSVKAMTTSGPRDAFVKIPKFDMRGLVPRILPISSADRRMGQEEEASLRLLGQKWSGAELEVRWVDLIGVIPEYNAIVTGRVFADEAVSVFRRWDLRRRFGLRQDAKRLQGAMARIGEALGHFHQSDPRESVCRLSEMMPKFEFYCREITGRAESPWPGRILEKLQAMGDSEFPSLEVTTLKGLDIRNVLIDPQGRCHFLDPGKMKPACREADLARFIATYRLLHWGSVRLALLREPDRRAELEFLRAYGVGQPPVSRRLLNLYLIKEELKHWHNILDYVRRCDWPPVVKRVAIFAYVNPFFCRLLRIDLSRLEE